MQRLRFHRPPYARTSVTAPPGSRTASVRDRANLPDRAAAGVSYHDVRIERAFAIRLRRGENGTGSDEPPAGPEAAE